MSEIIFDRWVWITIISACLVLILPFIVIWFILSLSPELKILATILIVVLWGVVSGYKEWITSKHREERIPKS